MVEQHRFRHGLRFVQVPARLQFHQSQQAVHLRLVRLQGDEHSSQTIAS